MRPMPKKRVSRSKASDSARLHKTVIRKDDPRYEQWRRDSGSMDVRGIDTPRGKGIRLTPKMPRLG